MERETALKTARSTFKERSWEAEAEAAEVRWEERCVCIPR